jgi:hypothetical protein
MSRPLPLTCVCLLLSLSAGLGRADDVAPQVAPESVTLSGPLDRVQLVVTGRQQMRDVDLTRAVSYESADPQVATVDASGRVQPHTDGETSIRVRQGDEVVLEIPVRVSGIATPPPVSFAEQVVPVLTKAGCNSGACHASQYGKGEFKLSLFGFAPEEDHPQIVRHWNQRRISLIDPADSLVLKKPTLQVSHGGGKRFDVGDVQYEILLGWLNAGAAEPQKEDPHVVGMSVFPAERVCREGDTQQLRVVAEYDDGSTRDVTHLALFDSLGEGVAGVDESGFVTIGGAGQAAIMVRYQGQARVAMVMVPFDRSTGFQPVREETAAAEGENQEQTNKDGRVENPSYGVAGLTPNNFVDEAIAAHWERLGVVPSELCSDQEFIRRAYLDSIGTLPTPEKIEAFLGSTADDKREQLVDELLGLTGDPARDVYTGEWSAYWALKWGDLLRNNRNTVGDGGMWALHNWVRQSLRENMPVDQFVREIITAQGSIYANGPANYFKIETKPEELAETTAQVFLGVRMQCARCHHHPFEVYSQQDFYGLAAFFTRVKTKGSPDFGALGQDTVVMLQDSGSIRHPRSRQVVPPTPLLGEPVSEDVRDLRKPLADWITSPDNDLFARNIVNRFWGYYLGLGLVEPIDDMRATNPASVPALLDALAEDFVASGYDLKHLMRTIMTSRVYQLSSVPRRENMALERLFLHYNVKRLPAEVLLDAIDDACGTQERFAGVPLGTRAIELPDSNFNSYFLDTLGRPLRTIACECERTSQPNLAQVLHIANGDLIQKKLSDNNGRIAALAKEDVPLEEAIATLYQVTFSRTPTSAERDNAVTIVEGADNRRQGLEDLTWAMLNSREFLFNH